MSCDHVSEILRDQVHTYADADECASSIRQLTKWWMGAFTAVFTPDQSQVLMVQLGEYAKTAQGEYQWTLPGGSVEPHERVTAAARREVREETGIELAEPLTTVAWLARP